jgi:hypothetical protein
MAVDQTGVIDLASVSPSTGEMVLTITDHLDWTNTVEHQSVLQNKLNAYLAFAESGEVFERFPDARGRAIAFNVVFKFRPDSEGTLFLDRARKIIESAGFGFRHELFAESYGN